MKLWELDSNDEAFQELSHAQKEFAEFLWKRDYEGGDDGLLGHSGDLYYPEALKPLARRCSAILEELEYEVNARAKALDIEW